MTELNYQNSSRHLILAAVLEGMRPHSITRREAIATLVSTNPDLCYMSATLKYDTTMACETTNLKMLKECGIHITNPSVLIASDLPAHLDHIINSLAALNVYVCNTNHLTDHECYSKLYAAANDPIRMLPPSEGVVEYIDLGWRYGLKGGLPAICNRDSTLPRPDNQEFQHVAT